MAENNMSVFNTNIVNLPDLAKEYLFQVHFEFDNVALRETLDSEEMILRAKSGKIPGKSFSELFTEYMGSKVFYPGKATVDGDLSINFDEFQDLFVTTKFHIWQNLLYNHSNGLDIDAGQTGAFSNYLKDYTATITVYLYDSTLTKRLPVGFRFLYCFPKSTADANLTMSGDAKVVRDVTFKYSTYQVISTI